MKTFSRADLKALGNHQHVDHELRRAYELAKQLAEALEVANLRGLQVEAINIRERVFAQLAALHVKENGRYG